MYVCIYTYMHAYRFTQQCFFCKNKMCDEIGLAQLTTQ